MVSFRNLNLSGVFAIILSTTMGLSQTTNKNPFEGHPDAIGSGKKTYANYCQACHGGDGQGGRGPSLASANLKHGKEDWQLYQTIRQGIPGTQMPPFELSQEQIWELVSYLQILNPTGKEERVPGDPIAGEKIFFGKGDCVRCHQINGRGGRVGPDLSTVGLWTSQGLRDAVLNPNNRVPQRPEVIQIKTKDGHEIRGVRRNEDTFSIQLIDENDQIHLFEKKDLASLTYTAGTLMPSDYAKRLSQNELENLIAYLKTLRQRDLTQVALVPLKKGLSYERLRNARREPNNWMTYWGDYQGRHYSPLSQVNRQNVNLLQAVWAYQFPGTGVLEATPLVVDGILYSTGTSGYVFALDAVSGNLIWQYQHRVKGNKPTVADNVNRGVAILG